MYRIEAQQKGKHRVATSGWISSLEEINWWAQKYAQRDPSTIYHVCKENPCGVETFVLYSYNRESVC